MMQRPFTSTSDLERMSPDEMAFTLREWADHYYNGDAQVSDEVYDRLRETLAQQAPDHPVLREVGAPIQSDRTKVRLPYRMGSLDKVKAEDTQVQARLQRWMKEHPGPYTVSAKLDGSSCLLVWRAGAKRPSLYTRGDGVSGVDISHLAPFLLPAKLPATLEKVFPDATEVALRGELLIRRDLFQQHYAKMARPRSLVNGLVNRKEVKRDLARHVDLVLYEVVAPRMAKTDQMRALRQLSMSVVQHEVLSRVQARDLETMLRTERATSVYDLDGMVIEAEGPYPLTIERTPSYALAFKAAEEAVATRVVQIKWSASKDGFWKPTIEYEPVTIAGTVLRHATGFHGQFVQNHGLGPGAEIRVGLGGDVIPQVVEVRKAAPAPQFPPADEWVWDEGGVEIRLTPLALRRSPELARAQLLHFVTTLGIPHLNEGTLLKLQEVGVTDVAGLLRMTEGALAQVPGLGTKSAERILEGIRAKTRNVPLARWMAASNAFGRGFGEKRLQWIVHRFPHVPDHTPSVAELCTVDGIEEKTAQKFLDGLPRFREWTAAVPGINWSAPASATVGVPEVEGPWKGQLVVFTGFRSEILKQRLEALGATLADQVTRKTTLLVCKEGDTQSTKARKAQEFGARVLERGVLEAELGI